LKNVDKIIAEVMKLENLQNKRRSICPVSQLSAMVGAGIYELMGKSKKKLTLQPGDMIVSLDDEEVGILIKRKKIKGFT
jgi:hypothetical protein